MIIELIPGLELEATKIEIFKTNTPYEFITIFNDKPYEITLEPGTILKCKYGNIELCNNFQVSDAWNVESENKLALCGEEI